MAVSDELPLFDPGSVYWRVNREGFILLGGGAALLQQVAHPLVAAGVAEHSNFTQAPLRRLSRTLTAMHSIIYGPRPVALAAARGVNRAHDAVRGVLKEDTPNYPAGTPYRASEPELLLWVHATLVRTALFTYEQFMPRLSADERDAYYRDSQRLGHLLGLKPAEMPADFPAFERYYEGMISGGELALTPTVARLADQILYPPISWVPRVAGDVLSVATAALLPAQLRELYGLKWSRRRQFAWRAARRSLKEALPYVPDMVRAGRRARRGERLVRAAQLSV